MFWRPRCRVNVLPPVIHPTLCCENHLFHNYVVPHIHPSHTTTFNHHIFQHQHYFPHTVSVANDMYHHDVGYRGFGPRPLFAF
jgi:spore coat protein D